MSESVAEEKREEPKRTLSRRSHGGPEESGPCYNLLALSEAQWDGDEDVESSLQPVKKRPKKKKQPKDAYMKESDGSLDDDAYSKNPSTVKRTRKPKVERPRWWIQSFLLFLALRQADRPLSRRVLLPRALELDRKIAKQRGLPLLFGGKVI